MDGKLGSKILPSHRELDLGKDYNNLTIVLTYEITYLVTEYVIVSFIYLSVQIVNPLFAKFFRAVYRKEPVSGFILILGATDALIGGIDGHGGLLSIGLFIALLGLIMRWRQGEKRSPDISAEPVKYLLPPASTRQPLPLLMTSKHRR